LSFAVLKIRIDYKKSIEEILLDFGCDPLQYAGELRKKGFTATLSAWYLADENLHFLPEGHKRLVLNIIAQLRTHERVKM